MTEELDDIAYAIKLQINSKKHEDFPRPYLGMSQLGHSCTAYLWHYFHWSAASTHDAKNERIFRRGDLEEPRVISYLKDIGAELIETQTELTALSGHLKGHTDGLFTKTPGLEEFEVLLECKTMQQKCFTPLTKKGLYQSNRPYWWQAVNYLHHSGADYCLHITTNKNTEELHVELISPNNEKAEEFTKRAEHVIQSPFPCKKISTNPTYFECTWCQFYGPCQLGDNFLKSCRSCKWSKPAANGTWVCENENVPWYELNLKRQKTACDVYDMIEV